MGFCGNMDGRPGNDGWCWNPKNMHPQTYKHCWGSASGTLQRFTNEDKPGCDKYVQLHTLCTISLNKKQFHT